VRQKGAIASDGELPGVETSLPDSPSRFVMPAPPTGEELIKAIRASLDILKVAPLEITVPVYRAVWRAAMRKTDFSEHMSDPTVAGKAELAALAQQHYGPGMDSRHLPVAWSSTGNALGM